MLASYRFERKRVRGRRLWHLLKNSTDASDSQLLSDLAGLADFRSGRSLTPLIAEAPNEARAGWMIATTRI